MEKNTITMELFKFPQDLRTRYIPKDKSVQVPFEFYFKKLMLIEMEIIENILKDKILIFEFEKSDSAVHKLKEQTKNIPNLSGLYFVFCQEKLDEKFKHLEFNLVDLTHTLLYFGKAGGVTLKGNKLKQGLKGRLNNVISDSSRNLKDIKRAKYWEIIMDENNISILRIVCFLSDNPSQIEESIYNELDKSNKIYPFLNKKRGRNKKK